MKLHLHSEDCKNLVALTSQELEIEEIYVEKDYFVVLALKGLSVSDYKSNGILKGGTSLSKAYEIIKRFSEDLDMAIVNDAGTNRGSRNIMNRVEEALTSNEVFTENSSHNRVKKRTRLRQTVHNYPLVTNVDELNYGQISPHIFIDVSRIVPGIPFEECTISTYIYDFLIQSSQDDVINEFELSPISINTLSIERTFAEKFGTVVKYASQPVGETSPIDRLKKGIRHIYDLHLLLQEGRIQSFLEGKHNVDGLGFNEFLERVLQDDLEGMQNEEEYNHYMNANFSECLLYNNIDETWKELRSTYEGDFNRLLFQSTPPPTSKEIVKSLENLKKLCQEFDQWKKEMKRI